MENFSCTPNERTHVEESEMVHALPLCTKESSPDAHLIGG